MPNQSMTNITIKNDDNDIIDIENNDLNLHVEMQRMFKYENLPE